MKLTLLIWIILDLRPSMLTSFYHKIIQEKSQIKTELIYFFCPICMSLPSFPITYKSLRQVNRQVLPKLHDSAKLGMNFTVFNEEMEIFIDQISIIVKQTEEIWALASRS